MFVPEIEIGPAEKVGPEVDRRAVKYEMYDISGRKIFEEKINKNIKNDNILIKSPNSTGLYFVRIKYSDNAYNTYKVFVEKSNAFEDIPLYIDE